jgi:hypothetical protein
VICPWVFNRSNRKVKGKPITTFVKAFTAACTKAGYPGRIPHDLRRTAVRNLVRAGVPERVAMQMTGHKTRSVFVVEAARKLNAIQPASLPPEGGSQTSESPTSDRDGLASPERQRRRSACGRKRAAERTASGPPSRLRRYGGQPSRGLPTVAHAPIGNDERRLEAPPGFEPGMEVLQTSALPLGDGAGRIRLYEGIPAAGYGRLQQRERGAEMSITIVVTCDIHDTGRVSHRASSTHSACGRKRAAEQSRRRRPRARSEVGNLKGPTERSLIMERETGFEPAT